MVEKTEFVLIFFIESGQFIWVQHDFDTKFQTVNDINS